MFCCFYWSPVQPTSIWGIREGRSGREGGARLKGAPGSDTKSCGGPSPLFFNTLLHLFPSPVCHEFSSFWCDSVFWRRKSMIRVSLNLTKASDLINRTEFDNWSRTRTRTVHPNIPSSSWFVRLILITLFYIRVNFHHFSRWCSWLQHNPKLCNNLRLLARQLALSLTRRITRPRSRAQRLFVFRPECLLLIGRD